MKMSRSDIVRETTRIVKEMLARDMDDYDPCGYQKSDPDIRISDEQFRRELLVTPDQPLAVGDWVRAPGSNYKGRVIAFTSLKNEAVVEFSVFGTVYACDPKNLLRIDPPKPEPVVSEFYYNLYRSSVITNGAWIGGEHFDTPEDAEFFVMDVPSLRDSHIGTVRLVMRDGKPVNLELIDNKETSDG